MSTVWRVLLKELVDALRDRRTLMAVLFSSVLTGPLFLGLISVIAADAEERAEVREVLTVGIDHAPTLRNFLARQAWTTRAAPADYEAALQSRKLGDPVLVIEADFEQRLARGDVAQVKLVVNSGNTRAQAGQRRLEELLRGFNRERGVLALSVRGVSPALVQPVQVQTVDLASPGARAAMLTGMLPFFMLMAMLSGALHAAMDTTAGERERGSLEPLLMNPSATMALVLGKWGAVAAVAMGISVLSCLSFLPGQWLLRSESLAVMFRFGPAEALGLIGAQLPLAGALAAVLMAVASRSRTVKEAQASATFVTLGVSLLPLAQTMSQNGEQPWHLWVPVLAQSTLMARVLKGEAISVVDWLLPALACAVCVAIALYVVAWQLRQAVQR